MTSTSQHRFTVAPSIITHLIRSQAGSCAKALGECVMNSVDAATTRIDITIDRDTMTIADDGHGFRTEDEITECFGVFGFDHAGHDRVYGRFGLGRGQLWNFCTTRWRTREFEMAVDVRNRGLDYELQKGMPDQPGLTIHADFYSRLTIAEETQLLRELEELCKYCAVPVFVNGVQVSVDPATMKWDIETEDAYIRINDTGHLKVYNQGIFVTHVQAYNTGISGTLVTKRGRVLEANMARNDIMREDPLWKKLHALCKAEANKRVVKDKTNRLTENDRKFMANQLRDPGNYDRLSFPLFTLSDGRHVTYEKLLAHRDRQFRLLFVSVAKPGDRVAEKINREKTGVILSTVTLDRFGVESVHALFEILAEAVQEGHRRDTAKAHTWRRHADLIGELVDKIRLTDDIKDVPAYVEFEAAKISDKELSPTLRHFLKAATSIQSGICDVLHSRARAQGASTDLCSSARRSVFFAKTSGAEAFTDGSTYIGIDLDTAKSMLRQGLAGFYRLSSLLVHEMLHNTDDSGSHAHDLEFYEAFHEITLDHAPELTKTVLYTFREFHALEKRKSRATAHVLDTIEMDMSA